MAEALRVVIAGGGTLDVHLLHQLAAMGANLVGADGGGDVIAAAGLVPDAIIGDFDSLIDPQAWEARTRGYRRQPGSIAGGTESLRPRPAVPRRGG